MAGTQNQSSVSSTSDGEIKVMLSNKIWLSGVYDYTSFGALLQEHSLTLIDTNGNAYNPQHPKIASLLALAPSKRTNLAVAAFEAAVRKRVRPPLVVYTLEQGKGLISRKPTAVLR